MTTEVELKATLWAAFNLIWVQLTPGLQAMIAAHNDYKSSAVSCDIVWLLERLKIESSGMDLQGNKRVSFFICVLRLLNSRQSINQTNESYYDQFLELVHAVELLAGVKYFCNKQMMTPTGVRRTQHKKEGTEEVEEKIETYFTNADYVLEAEKMKAVMFLLRCDHKRYGDLLKRMEDDDIFRTDNYPETVVDVFALLNREVINLSRRNLANNANKNRNKNRNGGQGAEAEGVTANVMFAQWELCANLGLPYGESMVESFQFVQEVVEEEAWVLLDTGSTCSSTNLSSVLENIREHKATKILTNAGSRTFIQKGTFKLFPIDMYYHEESLATVLSFHKLQAVKGVRITYDSDVDDIFHVEHNDECYDFSAGGGVVLLCNEPI